MVAVLAVLVMQVSAHGVIDMARVRHGFVAARRMVAMRGVVRITGMPTRAVVGIYV